MVVLKINRRIEVPGQVQKQHDGLSKRAMRSPGDDRHGLFFDSTAMGWFLRLLFFPSGIITLILVLFLLKRGQQDHRVDGQTGQESEMYLSTGSDYRVSIPKIDYDREIEQICKSLKVERHLQRELELCGRLDSNSCGYCLGEGCFGGYLKLPCGHYHHRSCVRQAMRVGLVKCIDCGDSIINVEKLVDNLTRVRRPTQ